MVEIRGPKGPGIASGVPADQIPQSNKSPKAQGPQDSFQGAQASSLLKSSGFLSSGAMKVFSHDGVTFSANLLDIHDPQNDSKYLRLMAAALGMEDLEWHFKTWEEERHSEWVEKKEHRRIEREEEREREQQENSEEENNEEENEF